MSFILYFIAMSYTSFAFFVIFMQEAMVKLPFFLLFLDFANLAEGVLQESSFYVIILGPASAMYFILYALYLTHYD